MGMVAYLGADHHMFHKTDTTCQRLLSSISGGWKRYFQNLFHEWSSFARFTQQAACSAGFTQQAAAGIVLIWDKMIRDKHTYFRHCLNKKHLTAVDAEKNMFLKCFLLRALPEHGNVWDQIRADVQVYWHTQSPWLNWRAGLLKLALHTHAHTYTRTHKLRLRVQNWTEDKNTHAYRVSCTPSLVNHKCVCVYLITQINSVTKSDTHGSLVVWTIIWLVSSLC